MIHPWMQGKIIVENSDNSQTFAKTTSNEIGSAQLDQSIYHVKQNEDSLVKIFGTISNPLKESRVEITITNPEYNSDGSSVITTDGYYELFFPLDYDSPEGTYKVLVSYSSSIIGQMTFDVIQESQFAFQNNETEISTTKDVAIAEKEIPAPFVDTTKDPSYYVKRYVTEPDYKDWFERNYPDYTFYEAIDISESEFLEYTEIIMNTNVQKNMDDSKLTESIIATLGIKSTHIVIHESANKAYMVDNVRYTSVLPDQTQIHVIDLDDNSITSIEISSPVSSKIIIDERNERGYFLFSDNSRIGVIDTKNDKIVHEAHKGPSDGQLVIYPSKKLLYFLDRGQSKLFAFPTKNDDFSDDEFYKSGKYVTELEIKNPEFFAINENTNQGYMTERRSGIIHIFDLETNSEIDSFTNCCNQFLFDFVVDSNSNKAYSISPDHLNVIDLDSKQVEKKISINEYTRSMDINFKTQRAYLIGDGEIEVVDLKTKASLGSLKLPTGWSPEAIAVDESTNKALVVDNLGKSFVMDLDCNCPEFLDEMKLQAEEEEIQKEREREIQDQIKAIRGDWYSHTLQPFAKVPSSSEMLDMMGKEKVKKYKEFFEGLQPRNIQAGNLELLLSSDKITLEEKETILNYLEDSLLVMKTFSKDKLDEYDDTVQQIINEINEKDLPESDKSQLIKDIQLDSDTRKNQIVNGFADVIRPLESILAKEKSKQGIIDELTNESPISSNGGGCLIATATYGSELTLQVQQLRELRDNSLLQTKSGTAFMESFNQFYYSFSPVIADYERENPIFKELVKITLTPLLTSLSFLNYVDMDSEESVLGYGISLILLNLGMYVGIPVIVIIKIRKTTQNDLQ